MVFTAMIKSSPTPSIQSLSQAPTSTLTSSGSTITAPSSIDMVAIGSVSFLLERSGDEFVATDARTGTYGEGDNEGEALASLLVSLKDLRDTLREHDGHLAPDLAADLEYLNRIP